MEIHGVIHCLFEQSGAFKEQFRQLGYAAVDYDICNDFGKTDWCGDIFRQINRAYAGKSSIFDNMLQDDLIMAFFPCTYFSSNNWLFFQGTNAKWQQLCTAEKLTRIIGRAQARQLYYVTLLKLFSIVENRRLRLILENPYKDNFLCKNLPYKPFIDINRMRRGDSFVKPTMYYFVNCKPTNLITLQNDKVKRYVQRINGDNLERSLISSDYARNFICDCVIGREQSITQKTLFDYETDYDCRKFG